MVPSREANARTVKQSANCKLLRTKPVFTPKEGKNTLAVLDCFFTETLLQKCPTNTIFSLFYWPVYSIATDRQRIDTPVVSSVALSRAPTQPGTNIYIHLRDPRAYVRVCVHDGLRGRVRVWEKGRA